MRLLRSCLSTVFAAILLAPISSALAGPPGCPGGSGAPGTITITEKKMDSSQASVVKELKAAQACSLTKGKEDDGWKLHLVAHLNKQPGADEVNLVLYDSTKPAKAGNEVQAYPIRTAKTAKIMMAEIEIKPEDGFKAGNKYNVLITRLVGGREEVYARTTLELK